MFSFAQITRAMFSNCTIVADVDECSTVEDICENGECINQQGTFQCICPPGFEISPDGTKCVDYRQEECYETYERGEFLPLFFLKTWNG